MLLVPLTTPPAIAALRGEVPPPVLNHLEALLGDGPGAGAPLVFRLNRQEGRYEKGEILTLTIEYPESAETEPPEGLLVYADYYLLDGQVAHLLPSRAYAENRLSPGDSLVLGAEGGPVRYEVLPPFGSERLVLLVTEEPLFPEGRPDFEAAQGYLIALESALAETELVQTTILTVETFDQRPGAAIAEPEPEPESVVVAEPPPATETPRETLAENSENPEEPPLQEAALPPVEDPEPEAPMTDIPLPEPELSEADIFYAAEVAPRLQRLADAGDDTENLVQLMTAYGTYARLLAESGDHAKALRTLDFALALDFENPDLTSLREEIAAAAP